MTYIRTEQGYVEREDGMDTGIGVKLPFSKKIGENPLGHAIDGYKLDREPYMGPNPAARPRAPIETMGRDI